MKKKLIIQILITTIILILCGLFVYTYIYRPNQLEKEATILAQELIAKNQINEGDIIFQTTKSQQTKAIQLATHSEFDHCGLICKEDGKFVVFEAVKTIRMTSLKKWIMRGVNNHFVIKRLKDSKNILTSEKLELMHSIANSYKGKTYDSYFEWSDDRIYCSELVWKIYKQTAGIEVGKLQKLSSFDLTDKKVQRIMKERYGSNIPMNETVISPVDIYNSDLLETVRTN